ncbi:Transcription initiation factor IIA subunit 1 [Linum grandiflorum]
MAAASTTTTSVYIHVFEETLSKFRDSLSGVELKSDDPNDHEPVLDKLRRMWEEKMVKAGVFLSPIEGASGQRQTSGGPTPVHDLNVPYEGTEEYETPTAEMLFNTPLQTPMQTPLPVQTPLPGTADNSSIYNIPTGNSSEYLTPSSDAGGENGNAETKPGRPSPFMQPLSPWMQQRPAIGVDVNVAYEEGREEADRGSPNQPLMQDFLMMNSGKRKREDSPPPYNNGAYIPQQDGAGDSVFVNSKVMCMIWSQRRILNNNQIATHAASSSKIPQLDGPVPDPYDISLSTPNIYNYQGVVNEDYNIANTPAPPAPELQTPVLVAQNDVPDDDDEDEPLNENDDDEEDVDDVDQGDEVNMQHLIVAQFDKVSRAKTRWKCILKGGIMRMNNKDILFNKATGEFDF